MAQFYDLCVRSPFTGGQSSLAEIVKAGEKFGFSGICIVDGFRDLAGLGELKAAVEKAGAGTKLDIALGAEIRVDSVQELKKVVEQVRDRVEVLIVSGGDYNINRAACEDSRVDILLHPEAGRIDSGLDETCAEAAQKNSVAIGFSFKELLNSFRKQRAKILESIGTNAQLLDKTKGMGVAVSSASSVWEMREPRQLASVLTALGFELSSALRMVSENPVWILEKNRKVLAGKRITEGVEIVG